MNYTALTYAMTIPIMVIGGVLLFLVGIVKLDEILYEKLNVTQGTVMLTLCVLILYSIIAMALYNSFAK